MFYFITLWLFSLSVVVGLGACSGAAQRRAALLNSQSGNLALAPPEATKTEEELAQDVKKQVNPEPEPPPDDPKKFNYFPYDLQVDTLAYMGCETNDYWAFKVGSYFSRSGLRLSDYFLKRSSLGNKKLEDLIKTSTKQRAFPYFAVTYKNQLSSTIAPKVPFNTTLPLHNLISDLVSSGKTRVREYNGDPISAKITNSSLVTNFKYREGFESQFLLFLYYKGGAQNTLLGVPGPKFYGRTYKLGLIDLDLVSEDDQNDRYALESVEETKLPTDTDQTEWECPTSLRFQIRRHPQNTFKAQQWYDAQSSNYKQNYGSLSSAMNADDPTHRPPPDEPTCPSSSATGPALKVAQAVLGRRWNINIEQKCVSPTDSGRACYHITTKPNWGDRLELRTDSDCDNLYGVAHCPRYVSICIRKN